MINRPLESLGLRQGYKQVPQVKVVPPLEKHNGKRGDGHFSNQSQACAPIDYSKWDKLAAEVSSDEAKDYMASYGSLF